ncbi:MAG: CHASE2 domain-containing protein [Muribaculaceae bacterium]|nr:CHASE2 domain-containing protein [Muribaculaceae bacterium]MCI9054507.1 CHASE2 domain-containing protein [Muribaculaceae bacterium]
MQLSKPVKAVCISLFAFVLSMVLIQPFSASTAALFSSPEKNDFTISDFYNIVADGRDLAHLDDNIVIVNLDNSDRAEIAGLLNMISLCGPKAVGLDVTFEDRREGDSLLLEAIAMTPALVQPLNLLPVQGSDSFALGGYSYFYRPGDDGFASSALPSKYANSTIREFRTVFPTRDAGSLPSFSLALARIADPDAAAELEQRGNKLEIINYHSRRFRCYEPSELLDHAEELAGRVVLLGALHEKGDLHPTPVNSMMAGIFIHANSLATVLDRAYMTSTPRWLQWLFGFLLCYLVVFTHLSLTVRIKGLVLRILQVGLLYATVQIGYYMFLIHNVVMDFSYALLMLTFGIFACDIWNGFAAISDWCVEKYRSFRKIRRPTTN